MVEDGSRTNYKVFALQMWQQAYLRSCADRCFGQSVAGQNLKGTLIADQEHGVVQVNNAMCFS